MPTLGACLVANDVSETGQLIIQRRIEGKSWAEIADELEVKGPNAARKLFTKETGITDYKIKGDALDKLVKQGIPDDLKVAKVPKSKVSKDLDSPNTVKDFKESQADIAQVEKKVDDALEDLQDASKSDAWTDDELQEQWETFVDETDSLEAFAGDTQGAIDTFAEVLEDSSVAMEKDLGTLPNYDDIKKFIQGDIPKLEPKGLVSKAEKVVDDLDDVFDAPFVEPPIPGAVSSPIVQQEAWTTHELNDKANDYLFDWVEKHGISTQPTPDEVLNSLKQFAKFDDDTLPTPHTVSEWLKGHTNELQPKSIVKLADEAPNVWETLSIDQKFDYATASMDEGVKAGKTFDQIYDDLVKKGVPKDNFPLKHTLEDDYITAVKKVKTKPKSLLPDDTNVDWSAGITDENSAFIKEAAHNYADKGLSQKQLLDDLNAAGMPEYQNTSAIYQYKHAPNLNMPLPAPPSPSAPQIAKELTSKFKSDTWLPDDIQEQVWQYHTQGKGYTEIKKLLSQDLNKYVDLKDIDSVVWNRLGNKYDGNIIQMLKEKPLSEFGKQAQKAVSEAVKSFRNGGKTFQQVAEDFQKLGSKYKVTPEDAKRLAKLVDEPKKYSYGTGGSSYKPAEPIDFSPKREYEFRSHKELVNEYRTKFMADSESTSAIRSYTGSGYGSINSGLRHGYTAGDARVNAIDRAMRPIEQPMHVVRHTTTHIFGTDSVEAIKQMAGQVVSDKGFLSTSVKPQGVFTSYRVRLEIDMQVGTRGYYVGGISGFGEGEAEFMLMRGTNLFIKEIVEQGGKIIVRMKTIP